MSHVLGTGASIRVPVVSYRQGRKVWRPNLNRSLRTQLDKGGHEAHGLAHIRRAERLDGRIENGTLDGRTEAEELREALEHVQDLRLEVSEGIDAYQNKPPDCTSVPC